MQATKVYDASRSLANPDIYELSRMILLTLNTHYLKVKYNF